jgi:adenosine deaminase CECR1
MHPVARAAALAAKLLVLVSTLGRMAHASTPTDDWFETLKATATPRELYTFLYALPKGGDLHNHLPGADRSEWLLDAALAQEARGYTYFTRVRISNCAP